MYQLFMFLAMFFVACSGPINDTTEDSYTIAVASDITGGVVSVAASSFKVGDLVRLEVLPAEGMKLKDGSLVYSVSDSGNSIPIRRNSFFMPAGHVRISANFVSQNDTLLSLRDVADNSVVFQGSAILDAEIISRAEDLTISWASTDESLLTVSPANSTGTRVNLMQIKPGRASVVGTSSDGSTITVEATMLDNYFRSDDSGEITGVTTGFMGGSALIPSYINGVPVKSIAPDALSYCGITEIEFPEGLQSIGENALRGNDLKSIKFPSKLTSVGKDAFVECPLETVICDSSAATNVTLGENALGENLKSVSVVTGSITPFREATSWEPYIAQIRSPQSSDITVAKTQGGVISVKSGNYEVSSGTLDEVITIEVTPNDGWQIDKKTIQVRGTEGYNINLEYTEDGMPFFIMPNRAVQVSATFEKSVLKYSVTHISTDSTEAGVNTSWGSVSVDVSDDLKTLTISPIPKFGYYLSSVSIHKVDAADIVKSNSEQNSDFVADLSKINFKENKHLKITAHWAPKILTVNLYSAGWTGYQVHNVKYGSYVPSLANRSDIRPPAKIGHIFMGFFSGANGSGVCYYDPELNTTGNTFVPSYFDDTGTVTLAAHFVPITYELTINPGRPNDNEAVPIAGTENLGSSFKISVTYNEQLPYVPTPQISYEMYRFDGYWTVPQNSTEVSSKIYDASGVASSNSHIWQIASNAVLEGRWVQKSVLLRFKYNGSTDSEQENILAVETLPVTAQAGSRPPAISMIKPYRTGFMFTGFYDSPTGGNKYYDADLKIVPTATVAKGKAVVEIFAQWRPKDVSLIFRYAENLRDGTDIPRSRVAIETVVQTTIEGKQVEQINGTEYKTRVMDQLPDDINSLITVKPQRTCYKFTGFYDTEGRRYYDEDLQLDEASITGGLMPPVELGRVYLIAGWELDGVEITSANIQKYQSGTFSAGTTYIFSQNVTLRGKTNNYAAYIAGTTKNPTNFYIKPGVQVKFYAGNRDVYRYSRTSGSNSSYLYAYVDYTTGTYGPTPGVYMSCETDNGYSRTWETRGSPFAGGAPGLYVPGGNCIQVFGEGKLYAAGADGIAAHGACSSPRMDADTSGVSCEAHNEARAYGASGGAGASGGGAGIGGYGGSGTSFTVSHSTSPSGGTGGSAGYIYLYGNISVYARGGKGGSYGWGSSGGSGREIGGHDDHSGAGGGGGGGAGGGGAGVGGGGGGGGAGGIGGDGIVANEHDGDSGSKSDGKGGGTGYGSSTSIANGSLYGYGGSGSSGGPGGNGGGVSSTYSPYYCFGQSGGSGGSGGGYNSIQRYDNSAIYSW